MTKAGVIGRREAGLLAMGAALGLPRAGRAQAAWPDRPVRLIVPFGAGGAADTLSRTIANAFPPHAGGQTLVVENRGGAGGTIAGAAVAQARPDGTTLMMADLSANAIARELQPSTPYDPATAFTPICHLVNLPLALVVPASLPVNDVAGFVALARQRGDMPYAHPGIGYIGHLAQEFMNRELGLKMTPVPYRSGAEVARSIIAAETQSTFMTVSTSLPFIREGKVKALAVTSRAPVAQVPGVPPLAATLPGFEAMVWHGILGPAGLPAEIVQTVNAEVNALLDQPETRQRFAQLGGVPLRLSPEAFADWVRAETEKWGAVIRREGLQLDAG